MAISAYDTQGRLKKNPLLGSSILSQPSRKGQVKQIRELHRDAATSGDTSRKAGVARLNKQYSTFAAPHMQRLSAISQKQTGLGTQLKNARDPAEEQRLQDRIKMFDATNAKLHGLSGSKLNKAFKDLTYEERANAELYYQDQRTGMSAIELGHRNSRNYTKGQLEANVANAAITEGSSGTQEWPEAFAAVRGHSEKQPLYGGGAGSDISSGNVGAQLTSFQHGILGDARNPKRDAQYNQSYYNFRAAQARTKATSYEDQINAEIDTINQSFIPLEEERKDRTRRLQDRADLYNMFLGT